MGPIHGVWLVLLGLVGVASLAFARRVDPDKARARWAPYQGWFGAVSIVWGAWALVASVRVAGWREFAPVFWYTFAAAAVVHVVLGCLLGVGTLSSFARRPEATAKLERMFARLAPWQGAVGVLGIGVGGWMVVAGFVAHP